jgi:hypothetical protein
LPNFAIEAGATYFFHYYGVGILKNQKVFASNLAEEPYGQARTRKRVFQKDLVGKAKVPAYAADFVFEEVAQGFDEGKRHIFGQAPDVVVGFDGGGGAFDGDGLDDVWVESALYEPGDFAVGFAFLELLGFLGEDRDEFPANDFAFLFGVGYADKLVQEAVGGVDADDA